MVIGKLGHLGVLSYVLNNGPESLLEWRGKEHQAQSLRETDNPAACEGKGMKMPLVTRV